MTGGVIEHIRGCNFVEERDLVRILCAESPAPVTVIYCCFSVLLRGM